MPKAPILVIDDDKHLVELIQQYLEGQGYVVYTALDGIHAHPMAQARKPALIILDVDMPMTNGLKALEQLRADPQTQSIPVILLTGVVSGRIFPFIENMPHVSHIKKPVQLEDLLSMVHHYIPESA
jgi:CheY-like chemotaxis protein